jgi:hypothetical protein
MQQKTLDRFVTIRAEIMNEIDNIDSQIAEVDEEIHKLQLKVNELQTDRLHLRMVLDGEVTPTAIEELVSEPEADVEEEVKDSILPIREQVVAYLKEKPGASRRELEVIFETDLKHVMGRLRKDGLIENRGASKAHARWYANA